MLRRQSGGAECRSLFEVLLGSIPEECQYPIYCDPYLGIILDSVMGLRDGGPERRRHLSANRLCASVVGKRGHGRGGCRTTRVSQAIVLQWNKGRRADAIHHQDQRGCLAGRNFVAWPLSPFVVGGKDKAAALFERSAPLRMSKRCRASGARLAHRPALTPGSGISTRPGPTADKSPHRRGRAAKEVSCGRAPAQS